MPVPPLPLELVALIVDHLADDLQGEGSQIEGLRVALVCKDWLPLGQALCWRSVVLARGRDDIIVDYLSSRPHLLQLVKHLAILGRFEEEDEAEGGTIMSLLERDDDAEELRDLMVACAALSTLGFVTSFTVDFLHVASQAAFAVTLSTLHLVLMYGPGVASFSPLAFATSLTSFTNLRDLDCKLGFFENQAQPFNPSSTASRQIALDNLSLAETSRMPTFFSTFSSVLAFAINFTALKDLSVEECSGAGVFASWLPSCSRLKTLLFAATDSVALNSFLPALLDILPKLAALEYLVVQNERFDGTDGSLTAKADTPALLPFARLLAALPAELVHVLFNGLYFDCRTEDLPLLAYTNRPETSQSEKEEQEEGGLT
ncbi:hypothetical protein JCM10213_002894 [Rhodosporidiobolus nylandii]